MEMTLSGSELDSVKKSFRSIYALFVCKENVDQTFTNCMLKWAGQLDITEHELDLIIRDCTDHEWQEASTPEAALSLVYDLVYLIYLDGVVEDIELKVATAYAKELGIPEHVVGELLKAIVAANMEDIQSSQLKAELQTILEDIN